MNNDKIIVLFDSDCLICNKSVQFIIKHDSGDTFVFGSQKNFNYAPYKNKFAGIETVNSVITIYNSDIYIYSSAALIILKHLKKFRIIYTFAKLLPKKWLDAIYKLIARNRYLFNKKHKTCNITKLGKPIQLIS